MDRRQFIAAATIGGAATLALGHSNSGTAQSNAAQARSGIPDRNSSWEEIKGQFEIAPGMVQMTSFYLASHPKVVRDAIERHRRGLDLNSVDYIHENVVSLERATRDAASRYMGVNPDELAFTDSTTMGLGLLYSGMRLKAGHEILTDTRDHIVTTTSARYGAEQSGASLRQTPLYADPARMTVDEVVENVRTNLRANTRLLAITWVHSGTGVKMPVSRIAEVVRAHNRGKSSETRTLLAVDGVHGFGIENVAIPELGADFFVAGTHKWLTGPRGTGLIWGRSDAWPFVQPTIPSFDRMWRDPPFERMPLAALHTPGGFHSFEHRWAVAEAFNFHSAIGKDRIAERIHHLNSLTKARMAKIKKVKIHTPMRPDRSAGIIAFEVVGLTPDQVVEGLHRQGVVGSVTPGFYQPSLARVAPSLLTTEPDVHRTVEAIAAL